MTQSAATEAWDRFLRYAAHARTKPSFDAEEREYRLDLAERLGGFLAAARDGSALAPGVDTVFDGVFGVRTYQLTIARQNRWLLQWAQLDELSLRTALAKLLAPDEPAQARFEGFATAAAQAQPADRIAARPELVLAFGSLFNFAVEPLALPVIRPARYVRLRAALGEEPLSGLPVAEQYGEHVAFAERVQRRLQEAGVPLRDMVDTQSLIWSAGAYMDNWGPSSRIGPPQRRPTPDGRAEDAGDEAEAAGGRAYLSICAIYRDEAEFLGASGSSSTGWSAWSASSSTTTSARTTTGRCWLPTSRRASSCCTTGRCRPGRSSRPTTTASSGTATSRAGSRSSTSTSSSSPRPARPLPELLRRVRGVAGRGRQLGAVRDLGPPHQAAGARDRELRRSAVRLRTESFVKSIVDPRRVPDCADPHTSSTSVAWPSTRTATQRATRRRFPCRRAVAHQPLLDQVRGGVPAQMRQARGVGGDVPALAALGRLPKALLRGDGPRATDRHPECARRWQPRSSHG